MRDIGILVWVALLIVGVIGSMISTVRRQMQASQPQARSPVPQNPEAATTQRPPAWLQRMAEQLQAPAVPPQAPPVPRARTARKPPAREPKPVVTPPPPDLAFHTITRVNITKGLFGSKNSLMRSVIAAEVLGKPRALRDE